MKSPKAKKKKKKGKSKSSKKTELDETKHDDIKEKPYITKEIETSITLLESPESAVVLEALLFLSKYADIQRNNLNFIQSRGLVPKLLALLDHNICILRVSLRLLSELLAFGAAQLQLNEDRFDEHVLKICKFYVSHNDDHIKEFALLVLEKYITNGKAKLLLAEPDLIKAILKAIKSPESEIILNSSLELLYKFIEFEAVRQVLLQQENFKPNEFIERMVVSEVTFRKVLALFEKITYFGDDGLQTCLKEHKVVEYALSILLDPEKTIHILTCLNILRHSMQNEITESYFIQSLEFLKFCQWTKTCPVEFMEICANIFLDLSKMESIRQMLFDLSVEDVILSFLRSDDKKILNIVFDAVSYMSKHKYCCEKIVTPILLKKMIQVLSTVEDNDDDPYNESALTVLFSLCRRDARTLHMIRAYSELSLILKYLNLDKLSDRNHRNLLDMVNMFVTNNQLKNFVLSPDLYDVILAQTQSKSDEISMRCLEILINCLNHEDFRDHFLLKGGPELMIATLDNCRNEKVIRMLSIFFYNAMTYDNLNRELIHHKLLLSLRRIPDSIKYRNPLIERVINQIYSKCLPIKFFETGRLELVDKISGRFYVMAGPWTEPFPFLEILELRQMSTKTTIYVIDDCVKSKSELICKQCFKINQQYRQSLSESVASVTSISTVELEDFINYGALSRDPYLPKYIDKIQQLVASVSDLPKKIKILAEFIDECLCGPQKDCAIPDKLHSFQLHVECIKQKLGTNMIPIGYLRMGFHCERALLFKALADQVYIPACLVKGKNKLYWNEIALIQPEGKRTVLNLFVVDLMNKIGQLLPVGSRECNAYCDIQ